MAITLLNVAEIIKKPSGLVFIYDSSGRLLQTIKDTKEIRRQYYSAGGGSTPNTLGWSLQFTFDDNESNNVEFQINNITLIQYGVGKFQAFSDLGSIYELTDYYAKFESVYAYLADYVFLDCCDTDPDNPIISYPTNTYANWLTTLNAGLLPKGLWIEVTDIPSQPSAIFSLFCTETNEITLGGFGQFLNADWQFVGNYTGVFGVTGVAYTSNLGQYLLSFEYVTLNYINLVGGTFTAGSTITDSVTGATAVVVSDDGVSSMSCYITSSGLTFDPTDAFDDGGGVSAEVDTISSPTIVNGDVVIYNCLHYQATDISLLDGTTPGINTSAYTLLPKSTANTGYITEVDQIEFEFAADWLQYRADKRGNRLLYTSWDDAGFGFTAIDLFQWGRADWIYNISNGGWIDQLNYIGPIYGNILGKYGFIRNNTGTGTIAENQIGSECYIDGNINEGSISSNVLSGNTGIALVILSPGQDFAHNTLFDGGGGYSLGPNTYCLASPGLNTFQESIDITGLTTLDLVIAPVGTYNLTSSNATETINFIQNFPANFPFILKPDAGLTVTITFTAVASLSTSNEIVGPTATLVLNGDNNDELTLQAATIGGFAVTFQKDSNTNI
jgi:hypothetical protein